MKAPMIEFYVENVVTPQHGGRPYGFGVTADGDRLFIPPNVVRNAALTDEDIGLKLIGMAKNNPRGKEDGNGADRMISMVPLDQPALQEEEEVAPRAANG